MQVIKRMIWSHQFWDWMNPWPRGGSRHKKEIADLWHAYANCEELWTEKDCDNCPPRRKFGDWFRDTFRKPYDPADDLVDPASGRKPGGSGAGGGITPTPGRPPILPVP